MPKSATGISWQQSPIDKAQERYLVKTIGIPPLLARVLLARGLKNGADIKNFLEPSLLRDWRDPLCIPGLKLAAQRVCRALSRKEKIAVFGDFDVDGMSAAALLTLGLKELGADVYPFIPDRFSEGYGLTKAALTRLIGAFQPDLIVTVDNGIAAAAEVLWLKAQGIDVVVTDHHEPADLVPKNIPVADPKLDPACASKELSGAGVALKLLQLIGQKYGQEALWQNYIELATLGTVSDMMLLQDENRALVAQGIAQMRHSRFFGIKALAEIASIDLLEITADKLPFSLIPRLNAAGRMGRVDVAFRLLITQDRDEARLLARELEAINNERREVEAEFSAQAIELAEKNYHPDDRVVVVAKSAWHEGVKGIVASRLVNHFHIPAIVFSIVGNEARGSGRSAGEVDLFHAVEQCSDLTLRFGGHEAAIGVSVENSRLDAFTARLQHVLKALPASQFITHSTITAEVFLQELSLDALAQLECLQPYGQGNPQPVFVVRRVLMLKKSRVGADGIHLRMNVSDGVYTLSAIMFRTPDIDYAFQYQHPVDIVFEPMIETWQGKTKVKLLVKDIIYAYESSSLQEETKHIAQQLLKGQSLLPAQKEALIHLGQGASSLCIMATGRGKSLIFYIQAAYEALKLHKLSIFVYPLRALVADQFEHLKKVFADMGIRICILNGQTPPEQRNMLWEQLACGKIGIVLTTPEFLAIHTDRFAELGSVGFLAVDEAHHIARAHRARSAYAQLKRIRTQLNFPLTLAVSATADTTASRCIQDMLDVRDEHIIIDTTARTNLELKDYRNTKDRTRILIECISQSSRSVVYVNSRDSSVLLARMLRHELKEKAERIAFYNAGMPAFEREKVECAFKEGLLDCIVSTSAFGEGVNIADIRDVLLYNLPFDKNQFNQMSGRAGRDGACANIWLLFDDADTAANTKLLASYAPSRDQLVELYRELSFLQQQSTAGSFEEGILLSDEEIYESLYKKDKKTSLTAQTVKSGIAIFDELGFLEQKDFFEAGSPAARRIIMQESPAHAALAQSACYIEARAAVEEFTSFAKWVFSAQSTELLESIRKPITPLYGSIVDGEVSADE